MLHRQSFENTKPWRIPNLNYNCAAKKKLQYTVPICTGLARFFSSSTAVTIPAIHRSTDTRSGVTPPIASPVFAVVAAAHKDAEIHAVKLRKRIDSSPRYAALVATYVCQCETVNNNTHTYTHVLF